MKHPKYRAVKLSKLLAPIHAEKTSFGLIQQLSSFLLKLSKFIL